MPNQIIRDEFINIIKSALTRAKNVSQIDHAGLRGKAREIFAADMLRPILPPYVELGTGKITDSNGVVSAETDVIVYSRQTLPPLVFEANFGLYPADAAIYAIEIKSKLTADDVRSTIEKFTRLRDLQYLSSEYNEIGQAVGSDCLPVIPCLFAFDTDLTTGGKEELDRYREHDAEADTNPVLRVFCVAGKGYWWFQPHEPKEKWIKHLPTDDHEEVVEFIGGIANTIPDRVLLKGRPRFGQYLIRPREFEKR